MHTAPCGAVLLITPGVRSWRSLLSELGLTSSTLALNLRSLIADILLLLTSLFLPPLSPPHSPIGGYMTPLPSQTMLLSGLTLTCLPPPPPIPISVWKTADWLLFQSLLHNLPPLPSLWNEATIETECNLLHESINNALDSSCPKLIIKPVHKLPWWDFSLDKSRRNAHRSHIHYRNNPTELNQTLFKRARRSHQRQCRKAKRESWKQFVSGSNSHKNAALLSKIVQHKINTNSIGYLRLPDGSTTATTEASLEALVDQHFPGNSTQGPPPLPCPLPPHSPSWTSPGLMTNSLPKPSTHSSMTKGRALTTLNPSSCKTYLHQSLPA